MTPTPWTYERLPLNEADFPGQCRVHHAGTRTIVALCSEDDAPTIVAGGSAVDLLRRLSVDPTTMTCLTCTGFAADVRAVLHSASSSVDAPVVSR